MPKLSPLIISMLLFGGVMLGIQSYYAGIQNVYSPGGNATATVFAEYESIMNRTNRTVANIEEKTAGFVNKETTDWTKYYDATLIFLSVLGVIAEFPGMAVSFLQVTIKLFPFGLPAWVNLMIGTIIVAIFIMIIAAIATKRDEM